MNKEYLDLINDLVTRTEAGELTWEVNLNRTNFELLSNYGKISISKNMKEDISFIILDSKDNFIVKENYYFNDPLNIQSYKVINVLYLLIKELTNKKNIDLGEILDFLDENDEDLDYSQLPEEDDQGN